MLARQRMVRPELGEDRDHDLAQEIAALGVIGLRDRLLKALQGRLELAGVPGLEAPGDRPVAVGAVAELQAEPRASGEALGLEVAVEPLDRVEGPGRIAPLDEQPPELPCRAGVAGIELERPSERALVVGRRELVGLGGDDPVQELLDSRRWDCAGELGDHLPVAEGLDRRDALNPEAHREAGVGVRVDLRQLDLAGALLHRGLERWTEDAARPAPRGPEVDDHGHLARALDDPGLEIGFRYVEGHRFELSQWRLSTGPAGSEPGSAE